MGEMQPSILGYFVPATLLILFLGYSVHESWEHVYNYHLNAVTENVLLTAAPRLHGVRRCLKTGHGVVV